LVREVVKAKGAGAYRLFGQPAHLGDVVRCRRLAADLTLAHHIDAQRVMRDLCRHIAPSDLGVAIRRSVLPAERREPTGWRRPPANARFALSLETLEWMATCSRLD